MYVCLECQETFETPMEWEETHGLGHGPYEKWSGCPYCGGGYVEGHECDCCGETIIDIYIKTDHGYRYCLNCYKVMELGDEE